MIYRHWRDAPWDKNRWPNFDPWEFACPCCGEFYYFPAAFDRIQLARTHSGVPYSINSAHRCRIHNARVGGVPLSEHKWIAFDVRVNRQTKGAILFGLKKVGFTTFGYYGTFIHTDFRPGRKWSTRAGRKTWSGLVTF